MADNTATKSFHIPVGSGHIYCVPFSGTIPDDATIEAKANLLGYAEKGVDLEYKPTTKKFADDFGIVSRSTITAEEAILKTSLIAWSPDDFKKFGSTAVENKAEETKLGVGAVVWDIGGLDNADYSLYLFRVVNNDKEFGDTRTTLVGTQSGGFKLQMKADDAGNMDLEIAAHPLNGSGTLIRYAHVPAATTTTTP